MKTEKIIVRVSADDKKQIQKATKKFHKETGISLGTLLLNKHNVAKQLHVLKMALEKIGVKGVEEDQYIMLNN